MRMQWIVWWCLLAGLLAVGICAAEPEYPKPSESGTASSESGTKIVKIPKPLFPVRLTNVVDGDTVDVDILMPWGVTLRNQRVRCADYDAWESSKRRKSVEVTDAEVIRGNKATTYLETIIRSGRLFIQPADEDRDNYGRVLGNLYLQTPDGLFRVADIMKAKRHVRQ